MKELPPVYPIPPSPRTFPAPENMDLAEIHARLADLGIQGVTRQGGKTWVSFSGPISLSVAKEIVRRGRAR